MVPITSDPWRDRINAGEVVTAGSPMNVDDLKPAGYSLSGSETLEHLRSDER
ncbi:hypothetical protein [Mycobacterium sp. MUNTM1]